MSKFYITQPVRCVHSCSSHKCPTGKYKGREGIISGYLDPRELDPIHNILHFLNGSPDLYIVAFDGRLATGPSGSPIVFLDEDLEPIIFDQDSDEVEEGEEIEETDLVEA